MSLPEAIIGKERRIAVLCGGLSSEREVSLVSGRAVAKAVRELAYPMDFFVLEENRLPDELDPASHLILPIIHGAYGENGELSAQLEERGFLYGGSDFASSVLCFDKLASKAIAARLGVPVAPDRHLPATEPVAFEELSESLGLPFILKPRRDGSSVGLFFVESEATYEQALPLLSSCDYLAEEFNSGIDLTVGILGKRALGVVGVRPIGGLYDYEHKYTSGMSEYDVPAKIPEDLRERLLTWSEQIFLTCGCRDIGRVDFHHSEESGVIFLETNTIPGMTSNSLLPKSARIVGKTFNDLVRQWIELVAGRIAEPACK